MKPPFWHTLTNAALSPDISIDVYVNIVCKDLMLLLSSKKSYANSKQKDNKLFNYGLTDLNRLNPESNDDRSYVQAKIQEILESHEPRLSNILVLQVEPKPKQTVLQMMFHIKADLLFASSSQLVIFDSTIETSTGYITIQPANTGTL